MRQLDQIFAMDTNFYQNVGSIWRLTIQKEHQGESTIKVLHLHNRMEKNLECNLNQSNAYLAKRDQVKIKKLMLYSHYLLYIVG